MSSQGISERPYGLTARHHTEILTLTIASRTFLSSKLVHSPHKLGGGSIAT
ncbi:MAG: hypothetical protein PHG66_01625 [Candidatus Colwellbacteria bacterium]|nr:hypothetical protein [Candidatus Colwellbacteria bacterium]